MPDDALTADPSSEAVEELLRQLVDARFVLTDREGSVTRWSRPAEELFGWPGARMLGRPLVKTLGLPDSLPPSGGQLETVVRRKDGQELEVAMALVPVRMSQSLEFNGFLEALEIAAPRGDALSRLGRSHRSVVEWIQAALDGNAHLDDDGLAAGTIVAFRPLNEPAADPLPEHPSARARVRITLGRPRRTPPPSSRPRWRWPDWNPSWRTRAGCSKSCRRRWRACVATSRVPAAPAPSRSAQKANAWSARRRRHGVSASGCARSWSRPASR